jgi:hypothetical protein
VERWISLPFHPPFNPRRKKREATQKANFTTAIEVDSLDVSESFDFLAGFGTTPQCDPGVAEVVDMSTERFESEVRSLFVPRLGMGLGLPN